MGAESKETETVHHGEPRVAHSLETGNESFQNAGILQLYVHNEAGQMVSLAANRQGPGEDVSYVRSPPGRYYLKINSGNIDWDVTVEDQR